MCHQIAKHFLCVCPDRNNPQCCPHAACLRIRAEAAVNDGGGGFVGTGWYTRSSPRGGQRHRVWEPYATVWEHCVAYQLKHTTTDNKKRTGGRVVQVLVLEEKKKEEEEEEGGGEGTIHAEATAKCLLFSPV
ncbi:uncharacterized protein B0T15DRAFT_514610 [Chaetomium strumarium]|uniref:Uncharacterized protein n=1 Tax=Chaetomium strumarium TaxID=1170767 RepID=A0AAJ0GMB3_9PEZI|nr:hypothetical protein B0T15DRAFT_514610 [Chaetomium strumarium]